jgi:thiol-disulfide isomerase/thioredoxin
LFVRSLAIQRDPDRAKRIRPLWDETGGSAEGWAIATARMPAPAERPPSTAPPRVALDFNPWVKVGFALPELKLRDLAGKTWTLADLKGKTTFVNVWATWCGPCRDELPQLQKLYEAVRDRGDVQVITLNIDENPGEVEPYMRANHYSFPALLLGRSYAESAGPIAIPQNWLVDASGTILQKSGGFDGQADWPKRMLERLTGIKPVP